MNPYIRQADLEAINRLVNSRQAQDTINNYNTSDLAQSTIPTPMDDTKIPVGYDNSTESIIYGKSDQDLENERVQKLINTPEEIKKTSEVIKSLPNSSNYFDVKKQSEVIESPQVPAELAKKSVDSSEININNKPNELVNSIYALSNAEIAKNKAQADVIDAQIKDNAIRQKAFQEMQDSVKQKTDDQLNKLNKTYEDLSKTEIDPNRYWNNKDSSSRTMLIISAFLAGGGRS